MILDFGGNLSSVLKNAMFLKQIPLETSYEGRYFFGWALDMGLETQPRDQELRAL